VSFGNVKSFAHPSAYCRGLASDLPRKSVEPIALAAGTAAQTL
jgi:SRSO17 transposase